MRGPLALLTVAIALGGCGAQQGSLETAKPAAVQSAPQSVAIQDDQFKPYREVATSEVRVGAFPNVLVMTLSARLDRASPKVQPMLRVEIGYVARAKRTYDTVRNTAAEQLRHDNVASNARCKPGVECTYSEILQIQLPEPELRQAKVTGYRMKLFARNGPAIEIGIPGVQITALFDKVDAATAVPAQAAKR